MVMTLQFQSDRGSHIAAVRGCVAVDGQSRLFGNYVPHLTVGVFAGAWPAAESGTSLSLRTSGPD
jgi:hypothetical protein